MDLGVISVRYARALLKCADEQKLEDKVYKEMQTLSQSYLEVPQLRFTIDNPILQNATKEQLLAQACGGEVSELTRKFIAIVLHKDRGNALQFMAASYITLYRRQKNIIQGTLTTATKVSQKTEDKMKEMVEAKTHGTVEFNTQVDPSIIGGFILEYDTYRMDASVKTKLNTILNELKN